MLEVKNLYASYGVYDALTDINMVVPDGQVVCMLGANGAGKSTTMRSLSGLLRPIRGSIQYDGVELSNLDAGGIVDLGMVLVPEGRHVFTPLTIAENLEIGAYRYLKARNTAAYRDKLDYVLSLFPRLEERMEQAAGTLSGGEQQMLAIGRALMSGPRLIMLDEPSMGLAPLVVADIFKTIKRLASEGLTVLIAEQNARVTLKNADYGYILQEGAIAQHGTSEALRQDESVQAAYLGLEV